VKTEICAFVFARGGSKGVPGKNIRKLGNKPLIAHSIGVAFESRHINRVIVSTDDEKIASVAREYGAEVPFIRPAELAGDKSPEWLAWKHAINEVRKRGGKLDVFVSLPPTAPLRSVEDVDRAIDIYLSDRPDIVITASELNHHPAFNMITIGPEGLANLAMSGAESYSNRQSAPKIYAMTTVAYVANPEFVMTRGGIFQGKVRPCIIPEERAIDIDSELDLKFAEFLLSQG
jgi:N-acylneuraminate cytidylyltransferase